MTYNKFKNNTKLSESHNVTFFNYLKESSMTISKLTIDFKKDIPKNKLLAERRRFLNSRFKFTVEAIDKLSRLNDILKQKEDLIYENCRQLEEDYFLHNTKKTPFTDYEIRIEMSFYSESIINRYKEFELDYIYTSQFILHYNQKENVKDNKVPRTNWVYFNRDFGHLESYNKFGFPMISRSFYELTERSILAYEDILQIDQIWWDIKFDYQYMEKIKL